MPVYNAEDFLEKSVDSVLQQDYSDFELLLIDDGSSDHSGELADTFSKKEFLLEKRQ